MSVLLHKLHSLLPGPRLGAVVDQLVEAVAEHTAFAVAIDVFTPDLRAEWMQMNCDHLVSHPDSGREAAEQVREASSMFTAEQRCDCVPPRLQCVI